MEKIGLIRFLHVLIFSSIVFISNGQSMFDPPITYFYETTYYRNSDGQQKIGSYDGKYFKFSFEFPNNRIASEYDSNGNPVRNNGGYIFTGRTNGYDKYVSYYNASDYYGRMQSHLTYNSYLLVSSDKKKVISVYVYSSGDRYIETTYEQGDPNNRRKKPQNNNSQSDWGSGTYTGEYRYSPSPETKKRTVTCTYCNGTGLIPYRFHSSCFNGCEDVLCNKCGQKHCINLTLHESCPSCRGTGKEIK